MAARPRAPFAARLLLATLIATGAGVLLPAIPAAADVDDFTFDEFHADMVLSRGDDGHAELLVTETIVARFPDADQNRGIVRAIPDDADGVSLQTEVLSVTAADGSAVPYETEEDGDFVEVSTGDDTFVRGVQVYVITYTQLDSIRVFDDTDADEFYRDINGTGWKQPFGSVSATIAVDPELTGALTGRTACYRGPEGSTDPCEIVSRQNPDGPTEFFPSTTNLAPGENMTVSIGFAKGTFVPGERSPVVEFAEGAAPGLVGTSIGAAVAGIGAAVAAWILRHRNRDAAGRGIVVAQYEPPRGLTILQAARLVGKDASAVPAAIVDLAVRGNLRILARDDDPNDVTLLYVTPSSRYPARQAVLDAVFGIGATPGARQALRGDHRDFTTRLNALASAAAGELRAAGLTEKRRHRGPAIIFALAVLAFIVAVGSVILLGIGGTTSILAIVAIPVTVVAGIAAAAAWRTRDRVTLEGARVREHLQGLREYLELAEGDRLRMLQSPAGAERTDDPLGPLDVVHLYESLLPYAVLWGVERDWAKALETRAAEAGATLRWYGGPGGFTGTNFTAALVATQAASASASSWSSSGGSSATGGSFGGGFSGGGVGGGGGGGR